MKFLYMMGYGRWYNTQVLAKVTDTGASFGINTIVNAGYGPRPATGDESQEYL